MTEQELFSRIDHTLLKAAASWGEIQTLCAEAVQYQTASVCIPPAYVRRVREAFGSSPVVCTVAGFPLGYSVTAAKVLETAQAVRDGAAEIDMVVNIGDVKNGNFDRVLEEVQAIREAAAGNTLKVIVETCYLTDSEKIRLCEIVTAAGADFIKTSTGFGSGGAALADINLFKRHVGPGVRIKAAGGITSRGDMEAFIAAGAARIGTSSAVRLLAGGGAAAAY